MTLSATHKTSQENEGSGGGEQEIRMGLRQSADAIMEII